MKKDLKVAIVHDYLSAYGGAEAVVDAISEIYPNADIYTAVFDEKVMRKVGAFKNANVFYPKWRERFSGGFWGLFHKVLIANLPIYFENLDLQKYDLVISSTAHFAKGVITHPSQLHVCYIHTPPRFLYKYQGETRKRESKYWRIILNPLDMVLRMIDYNFAQRPDYLLCNSQTVRARIKKFYRRGAKVINPFPDIRLDKKYVEESGAFGVKKDSSRSTKESGSYFLIVSRLVRYKNIDLSVKVCGKNNIPLKIAGTGASEEYLKELSSKYKSVEILGLVSQEEKFKLYKNCKGVLCTVKDEDFGMAPLEPMMFGRPVVALKEAGYLETVVDGVTGVFFEELTEKSLLTGIRKFEKTKFNSEKIKKHADSFNKDRFKREFKSFVDGKLKEFRKV